jgi:cyclopropane fatty-acyl-phospholipid synthase-like methyltransferase
MDPCTRARRAAAYENPRTEIQALVPLTARRILDLGCASGALGAALKSRQHAEVVGVEVEPAYADDAARRLDRVITADVEELMLRDDLDSELGCFDCLIAGDVLEHLREPWTTLARATTLLEPSGTAVVSLPNVRHWETFWQLGRRGTWPRRDEGIFDRGHLRWFTLGDALAMLHQAGLESTHVSRQYRLRPWQTRWDRHLPRLRRTPLRPFLVFQYVIAARRVPDGGQRPRRIVASRP